MKCNMYFVFIHKYNQLTVAMKFLHDEPIIYIKYKYMRINRIKWLAFTTFTVSCEGSPVYLSCSGAQELAPRLSQVRWHH